jgi:hypothetical protein
LDHIFDQNGLSINDAKSTLLGITRVQLLSGASSLSSHDFVLPQISVGFQSYYDAIASITETRRKIPWTSECKEVFQYLKSALTTASILALPNLNRPFILTTDASVRNFFHTQKDNVGRERVIEYGGRALHKNELNWTISEKEALIVIERVRQYDTYLHSHFKLSPTTSRYVTCNKCAFR